MKPKDFADIFFIIRSSIYWHLNFFIVGILAVAGWLILSDKPMPLYMDIGLSALFTIFVLVCFESLLLNYKLLEAAREDWVRSEENETYKGKLHVQISEFSYKPHLWLICIMCIVVELSVLTLIWLL
jgi:hypothetical protein